jgi:hypothetical protein
MSKSNQNGGQSNGNHNNFQKKIQVIVLTALIVVDRDILRALFKLRNKFNRNSGTSNNYNQSRKVFTPTMLRSQQYPLKTSFQVTCAFLMVVQVFTTADPWKG